MPRTKTDPERKQILDVLARKARRYEDTDIAIECCMSKQRVRYWLRLLAGEGLVHSFWRGMHEEWRLGP